VKAGRFDIVSEHSAARLSDGWARCWPRVYAFGALVLAGALVARAANWYVRPGAAGANNGRDWANAYGNLPATLVRGDTYYLAAGDYGSVTLETPAFGTNWINLRKATVTNHGTDVGWDDTYAIGQAVFTRITLTTAYWDIDGATGSGNSGHGIKVSTGDFELYGGVVIPSGNPNPSGKQFYRFVRLELTSSTGTSEGGFHLAGLTDSSAVSLDNPNLVVEHCYIHHVGGLAAGAIFGSYQIWRHNFMEVCCQKDSSAHKEIMKWDTTNSFIRIYGNVFKDWEGFNLTGGLILGGGGIPGTMRDWQIYNNVFCLTGLPAKQGSNPWGPGNRLVGGLDSSTTDHSDIHIYNNTVYGVVGTSGANILPRFGIWNGPSRVFNNLFVNCVGLNSLAEVNNSERDYNGFYNTPNWKVRSEHDVSLASNPLPNAPHDFHLADGSPAIGGGLNLNDFFKTDFDGNIRGSTWDIGAYTYRAYARPAAPRGLVVLDR